MPMTALEASTVLLLQFEQADANFVDSSAGRRRPTPLATAPTASTQSKFGGYCYEYAGATGNYAGLSFGPLPQPLLAPWGVEAYLFQPAAQPGSAHRYLFNVGGDTASSPMLSIEGPTKKLRCADGTSYLYSDEALPIGRWVHVEVSRDANGVTRLFVDGVPQAMVGSTLASMSGSGGPTTIVGSQNGSSGSSLVGRMDQLRYVIGMGLHDAAFTPPGLYAECPRPDGAQLVASPARVAATALAGATVSKSMPLQMRARDVYYGGRGSIVGTVKEKASPANMPLHRRVWLMRERDAAVIRETWSDPVTGNYAFANVDETQRYSVLTFDHLRNHRAVIADNLPAEV